MRLRLLGASLTFALCVLIVGAPPVSAQSNHSLEWGVEVGDEITYVLQRKLLDETFGSYLTVFMPFVSEVDEGQRITARVSHLDPIPSLINESLQMPGANCTLIRQNDSEIIMEDMFMVIVPIGDWNFSSELGGFAFFGGNDSSEMPSNFTDFAGGIEQVDTETSWGTIIDTSFVFGIFPISIYMEMLYEKTNGTLTNLRMRVNFAGNDMIDLMFTQWYPGIALVLPPELQLLTIGLISIGVVITLAVIVFYRRRRMRRAVSAIPQDGYTHLKDSSGL
ncbi:MAG: hypothetical protein ACXADC_02585 [Candidatus Thorarchaeota archaeon]|jgi:hypothetical protein